MSNLVRKETPLYLSARVYLSARDYYPSYMSNKPTLRLRVKAPRMNKSGKRVVGWASRDFGPTIRKGLFSNIKLGTLPTINTDYTRKRGIKATLTIVDRNGKREAHLRKGFLRVFSTDSSYSALKIFNGLRPMHIGICRFWARGIGFPKGHSQVKVTIGEHPVRNGVKTKSLRSRA